MKKHYSKKLKEEIERLEKDIYKIIDGDFLVTTHYKLIRQTKQDLEKVIWSGDSCSHIYENTITEIENYFECVKCGLKKNFN
jgi:hypothetical protein